MSTAQTETTLVPLYEVLGLPKCALGIGSKSTDKVLQMMVPKCPETDDSRIDYPEPPVQDAQAFTPPPGSFQKDLEDLINRHSIEGGSNTPDFILAEYLRQCLDTFDMITRRREDWYKN